MKLFSAAPFDVYELFLLLISLVHDFVLIGIGQGRISRERDI